MQAKTYVTQGAPVSPDEIERARAIGAEFRITYSIERRQAGDADFTEIGFGSTSAGNTVDSALYFAQSDIQNRQWETSAGMPDPGEV